MHGNLFWYIRRQKALPEKRAVEVFRQACDAIQYMHKKGFIHRDLKPENILLDDNYDIKVCDFGWCTEYEQEDEMRKTFCGTYEYMAPEIFDKKPYDEKIDVWALGILLYELIHGKSPYRGNSVIDIYKNIQRGDIRFSSCCSSEARDLVSKILKKNPYSRASMDDIMNHPLMRKYPMPPLRSPSVQETQNPDRPSDADKSQDKKSHKHSHSGIQNTSVVMKQTSAQENKSPKHSHSRTEKQHSDLVRMYNLSGVHSQSKKSIANDGERLKEETNMSTTADAKKQPTTPISGCNSKVNHSPKVNGFASYFLSKGTDDKNKSVEKEGDHSYIKQRSINIGSALQNISIGKELKQPAPSLSSQLLNSKHHHTDSAHSSRQAGQAKPSSDKREAPRSEYLIANIISKPAKGGVAKKPSFTGGDVGNQSGSEYIKSQKSSAAQTGNNFNPGSSQVGSQAQAPEKYYLDLNLRKVKRDNVKSLSRTTPKQKNNVNCKTFDEADNADVRKASQGPAKGSPQFKPKKSTGQQQAKDAYLVNGSDSDKYRGKQTSNEVRTWLEQKKQSLFGLELPRDKSDNGLIRNLISRKMTEVRKMNKDNKSSLDYSGVQPSLRQVPSEQNVRTADRGATKESPHEKSTKYQSPGENVLTAPRHKNKITACRELLDKISVSFCVTQNHRHPTEGDCSDQLNYFSSGKAVLLKQSYLNDSRNKENHRTMTEQNHKKSDSAFGSHKAKHLSFFEKDFSLVHRHPSIQRENDTPQNIKRDLRKEFSRERQLNSEGNRQQVEDVLNKGQGRKNAPRSNSFYKAYE